MTQQPPICPACFKPLTEGSLHDVCFSDDHCYRYFLRAPVPNSAGKGTCLFIMLNPSTAGPSKSDPTLNKCVEFAQRWGYNIVWICNLFGFIDSDVDKLRDARRGGVDIIGPANDQHVKNAVCLADRVVLAWGTSGYKVGRPQFRERVKTVATMLGDDCADGRAIENPYHLNGFTEGMGQPRHPLGKRGEELPLETPLKQFTNEKMKKFMRYGSARPRRP